MAIRYAGGTNRNDIYAALVSSNAVATSIKTTLVAAGWTATGVKEFTTLTMTGVALNNETVTLSGKVYTFKNAINNANDGEIFIEATAAGCLSNLSNAVILGVGSGTKYSTATTLNATMESGTLTASTSIFQGKVAGLLTPYNVAESLTNGSFSAASTSGGCWKMDSAMTPQFLQCRWKIQPETALASGVLQVSELPSNVSETSVASVATVALVPVLGAVMDLRVIANRYQAFVMIDGTNGADNFNFASIGVPWLPNFLTGYTVTAVTNTTPIAITVSVAHGYTTGDSVTIRNVLGTTAANVTNNVITVTGTGTFTLDGSVGNGAWVSGGTVGKVGLQVVECIWSGGGRSGSSPFRGSLNFNAYVPTWSLINGSATQNANGNGCWGLVTPINTQGFTGSEIQWFDSSYLVCEPFIVMATAAAATAKLVGQIWDMVYLRKALTKDVTGSFDGHNWWNLTDNVTSQVLGSMIHVVP